MFVVASNLSVIYGQGMCVKYDVTQKYKNAYVHYKQGATGCGPLNYVLCLRAIVRGNSSSNNYAPNIKDKWDNVIDKCGTTAATVPQLIEYFNKNDATWGVSANKVQSSGRSSAQKTSIASQMVNLLSQNKRPFVFLGAISSSSGGYVGHYYTVWSIAWDGTLENSTVYYTNTADAVKSTFDAQLTSMKLSDFFILADKNTQSSNYYLLYFQ
ncbi:MAG: hypothetical protein LBO09_04555 [Candidatus Peribacteria bacterium]|jgi:hypothetical protein|nr:hypothetical protein [Candidatus Peribacteria bacterium]